MSTEVQQDQTEPTETSPGTKAALPVVAILIPAAMRRQILTPETERHLAWIANVISPEGDELASDDLHSVLDGAVACLTGWGTPPLTDELLHDHPDLGLVAHAAGSIRRLIPESAIFRGLRVSHAAAVIADAVAEQVMVSALLCLRPLHEIDRDMRSGGEWFELRERYPGRLLGNQVVGIIGAGYVGRMVIRLFKAFGCRLLVADPLLSGDQAAALDVEVCDLPSLMSRADIVSLHAPVLPQTIGMIGAKELASLRKGGILINTARAALIDEQALLTELRSGRITAVLDVFGQEPLPHDSPFCALPNALLSPHSAGHTIDTHQRQGQAMVEEIQRFLTDEPLQYEVSGAMFATMA